MPLITAGFETPTGLGPQPSITDLTPLAIRHLTGVTEPARAAI